MKEWKKKHRVTEDTKVFICVGGYGDVKRALKSRGWVENKDLESKCFDLKWTLRTKDINTNALENHQIVNHYAKATSITTKVGLTHSLKNLVWFNNVDIDAFYPRCYDMGLQEELDDFSQEFKSVKAQCYLKIYVREMRESYEANVAAGNPNAEVVSTSVPGRIFNVALRVCKQKCRPLDDLIDDEHGFDNLVSDADWKILGADEMDEKALAEKKHADWLRKQKAQAAKEERKKNKKKKQKKEAYDAGITESQLKKQKKAVEEEEEEEEEYDDEEYYDEDDGEEDEEEKEQLRKDKQRDTAISNRYPEFSACLEVCNKLKEIYPQFNMDGERNIWILKPAGSSRGRGIVLYKNLVEIQDLCKDINTQYVAQKYIENSLIMKNRKFDIR